MKNLQQSASQRVQMFEALGGTERKQHTRRQLLKENLNSQELSHKHAQMISSDVNLSGHKDRVAESERELQLLKQQRSEDEEPVIEESKFGDRLRIQELDHEVGTFENKQCNTSRRGTVPYSAD